MRWLFLIPALLIAVALAAPLIATANDDVAFCLSCHIMDEHGDSIAISVHRESATCSECHTGSLLQKYTDGARHLKANLTGLHPVPITLRQEGRMIVSGQCAQCHRATSAHVKSRESRGSDCLECHRGHAARPYILPGVN